MTVDEGGLRGARPRRASRLRRYIGAMLVALLVLGLSLAATTPELLGAVRAWLAQQSALPEKWASFARGTRAFAVPPPPPRRDAEAVAPTATPPAGARLWRVGPGQPFSRIADVARRARAGDIVEIAAGDYHGEVAVWEQASLVIRGIGGAARLFADGRSAEGKAIWVLRDGDFDISNIDFIGARVADRNGAGIRFEKGRLRLRHCLFWDNEMGLLTGSDPAARTTRLVIENSEFGYSHVDGRWGHNLYVGAIAALRVTGSYFHHAGDGHLLKSRARRNDILYNRLTDEQGGRASYEIEFPEGGQVRMVGNLLQQAATTSNPTMIAVGAEGYATVPSRLDLASNTLVNDHARHGVFVAVAAGDVQVYSVNNLLVGRGELRVPAPPQRRRDVNVAHAALVDAARFDYRLKHHAPAVSYRRPDGADGAARLTPTAQYRHPHALEVLTSAPRVVGALQATLP